LNKGVSYFLKADIAAQADGQIPQSLPTALNLNFCPKSVLEQFAQSDFRDLAGLIKMPEEGMHCECV